MRGLFLGLANTIIILLITLFLAILQISLWPQLFGRIPGPQFWLITLSYLVIMRSFVEGLVMTYFLSFLVAALTVMPLNIVLTIHVVLFCGGSLLKRNIFWASSTYLMILSGLACLSFPLIHLLISWLLENNPNRSPDIFYWLVSGCFSSIVSPLLFYVFDSIDQLMKKEQPPEWRNIL